MGYETVQFRTWFSTFRKIYCLRLQDRNTLFRLETRRERNEETFCHIYSYMHETCRCWYPLCGAPRSPVSSSRYVMVIGVIACNVRPQFERFFPRLYITETLLLLAWKLYIFELLKNCTKLQFLSVLLYGCETWSLILREEHRMKVFEKRVFIWCRSQWPRVLRREMSSPPQTLGSWVRIPLEAWMFVCVYSVCAVFCVGSGFVTGWYPVQRVLPTVYRLGNWKSGQGPWTEQNSVPCSLQANYTDRVTVAQGKVGAHVVFCLQN
jgi:hypothetical protein